AKPKVVIPVFYGTNCEYDIENSFTRAGAEVEILPLGTLTAAMFTESIDRLEKAIKSAQILALAGGFSAGDEPDGSGKYIAVFLQNEKIKNAIK
ncbi:phosphoribosylformylglycinamidine synthase subunit PurQ, partial [Streptococcus danieliae]|nr:phosphoribosylformylglycinamidine synthase subunit PurQ [Streptococcus danieliae]